MNLIRGLFAVIAGYLIASGVAMGVVNSLFGGGRTDPELKPILFALAGLALGAIIAGFVCTLIVGSANHPAIYITVGAIIVMAVMAYRQGTGIEPDWYRFTSTLTTAIAFLVGASAAAYRLDRR
jgi:hypothetical protein